MDRIAAGAAPTAVAIAVAVAVTPNLVRVSAFSWRRPMIFGNVYTEFMRGV
jgi:hypothetical protein